MDTYDQPDFQAPIPDLNSTIQPLTPPLPIQSTADSSPAAASAVVPVTDTEMATLPASGTGKCDNSNLDSVLLDAGESMEGDNELVISEEVEDDVATSEIQTESDVTLSENGSKQVANDQNTTEKESNVTESENGSNQDTNDQNTTEKESNVTESENGSNQVTDDQNTTEKESNVTESENGSNQVTDDQNTTEKESNVTESENDITCATDDQNTTEKESNKSNVTESENGLNQAKDTPNVTEKESTATASENDQTQATTSSTIGTEKDILPEPTATESENGSNEAATTTTVQKVPEKKGIPSSESSTTESQNGLGGVTTTAATTGHNGTAAVSTATVSGTPNGLSGATTSTIVVPTTSKKQKKGTKNAVVVNPNPNLPLPLPNTPAVRAAVNAAIQGQNQLFIVTSAPISFAPFGVVNVPPPPATKPKKRMGRPPKKKQAPIAPVVATPKRGRGRPRLEKNIPKVNPDDEAGGGPSIEVVQPRKRLIPRPPSTAVMMTRAKVRTYKCIQNPDSFCYVCARFTPKKQQKPITDLMVTAYEAYFSLQVRDLDKPWTPSYFCVSCSSALYSWYHRTKNRHMKFAVPVIWREQKDHETDCWFCIVKGIGFGSRTHQFIKYPWHIDSVSAPIPHDESRPVPVSPKPPPPEEMVIPVELPPTADDTDSQASSSGIVNTEPILFTQEKLDDLLVGLGPLSSDKRQFLVETLDSMNLLDIVRRSSRHKNVKKRKSYVDTEDFGLEELPMKKSFWVRAGDEEAEEKDPDFVPKEYMEKDDIDQLILTVNLICPVDCCEIRVGSKFDLDDHLETAHQVRKFRCLAIGCTASFGQRRDHMEHISIEHTDPSSWKCGRCNSIKTDYSHLRNHINFHHQRGHLKCGFEGCDYESEEATRAQMQAHHRTHLEPIHQCTFVACGRSYTSRNALSRHLMTHTNDRRYPCTDCEKAFFSRTDLERHLLIHLGLKPHMCPHCGKCFTLKGSCDKHIKSQHREDGTSVAASSSATAIH